MIQAPSTTEAEPTRKSGPSHRVALVHDWLTGMRGGERAFEEICRLFPDATRFAILHVPGSVSRTIEAGPIRTSFIQGLPRSYRYYRQLLPLFPSAVEQFDLDNFDLVISTSHCAAKSIVSPGRARHLCYCFTPMRYAWDQFDAYFGGDRVGPALSHILRWSLNRMARWDVSTAHRVDCYVAISRYVAGRIRRYYDRDSEVVYPPVDTDFFQPNGKSPEPYFLVVSALVPYKRVDVAIRASALAGVRLRIIGSGPELKALRKAAGPDVEFLGSLPDDQVREMYQNATGILLPGIEDFGIVPVEAQSCGRPVVALARGGACETIIGDSTGILVPDPSDTAFAAAISRVLDQPFDSLTIRKHAVNFSRQRFSEAFMQQVANVTGGPMNQVAS